MIPVLLVFKNLALLFLRLVVGGILIRRGYSNKSRSFNWKTAVSVLEVFAGLLLFMGIFTQIIGLLLAIVILVIAVWKKIKKSKFINGYESEILLISAGLILATMGGGYFALLF